MHQDDDFSLRHGRGFGETMNLYAGRARDFIRTRRNEHWIMFFAGLVIGLVIG